MAAKRFAARDQDDMWMTNASEHAKLLELLSERLLAHGSLDLWRRVLLGPSHESIRFLRETRTFLATDAMDTDWTPTEIETLAARYDGRVEPGAGRTTLVFTDARRALELAMLLQRLAGQGVRTGLLTAKATIACFELDGAERCLTLGGEPRAAATQAERAAPGTIQLSAQSYRVLAPVIERHAHAALVTTELHDDVVTSAAITLPPARGAALSTFAGLGLS